MATVRELFEEVEGELRGVEHLSNDWVCNACLGPKGIHYSWCHGCGKLISNGAPPDLMTKVVPASIAVRPGRWYNRLVTYKGFHPQYRRHVAAVLWLFLREVRANLEAGLGGEWTMITPVPSKRGRAYEDQPLNHVMRLLPPLRDVLVPTLEYLPDADVTDLRSNFYPHCFERSGESPDGHRVLLVEDTWVTGATAVSAAGSLLERGAKSVWIVPVARVLDLDFWGLHGSPYVARVHGETARPYALGTWSR